ncbi:MAG: acetate--CoA ligase family protein [Coriobacteriia bacterium]|nr:acetate--CoA ligase family protein [Coriobacteriia bacterium]
MDRINRNTTLVELATLVSEALEAANVTSTLSGGAAVSIYTLNEYESHDLDFITSERNSTIAQVLAPLGFQCQPGTREFTHPDTDYFVEFPPGPLGLGETTIDHEDAVVIQTGYGRLRILTPTQSVMDRLAGYVAWGDNQALDQAVMIARHHELDWGDLALWAEREGAAASLINRVKVRSQGAQRHATGVVAAAVADGLGALDEGQAKALLAGYGITVPEGGLARDEDEAVAVALRLDGPVAIKAVGAHITHKTERGLVALNLLGEQAVRDAARSLLALTEGQDASLLVERMVRGDREFMIGMKRDPLFGPVVVFGIGGIFAEAHKDISLGVTPLEDREIEGMLSGIRASALLGEFRGMPSVDRAALADAIRVLAQIAEDHPAIMEIDVNPLMVEGSTPVAADALVILDPERNASAHGPHVVSTPDLTPLFAPRAVAVIGASDDIAKWGGSLLRNVIEGDFAGPIYPVNGRGGTVQGLPAFSSISELPDAPDLALVALGAAHVNGIIEQCGERGIPAALVVAAGFSEAGEEGAAAEAELVKTAKASGVTLIGPNCMGLLSTHSQLHAVGFLELQPQPGGLSIISQSGNIGVQLVTRAERRGVGIDKYVSVGNQASTSALDVLDALADDEQTTAALVYLEGSGDGHRFIDVMRRITLKKPVVVLPGGMTEYGRRAAASHTGAMAGSTDVFLAAARQTGCLVRTGPDESLDLALCLSALPLPSGRRVAVMTLGGGWGVLAADELARNDLGLASMEPQVLSALDDLLPGYWCRSNPVDLVTAIGSDAASRALTILAESDEVDAVVALGILRSPSTGWTSDDPAAAGVPGGTGRGNFNPAEAAFLDRVTGLMESTGKPIINVPLRPVEAATFPGGGRYDPVILYSPVAAVRALAAMAWYGEYVAAHFATQGE